MSLFALNSSNSPPPCVGTVAADCECCSECSRSVKARSVDARCRNLSIVSARRSRPSPPLSPRFSRTSHSTAPGTLSVAVARLPREVPLCTAAASSGNACAANVNAPDTTAPPSAPSAASPAGATACGGTACSA
eukprot:3496663-Rhodomonas_salina.1